MTFRITSPFFYNQLRSTASGRKFDVTVLKTSKPWMTGAPTLWKMRGHYLEAQTPPLGTWKKLLGKRRRFYGGKDLERTFFITMIETRHGFSEKRRRTANHITELRGPHGNVYIQAQDLERIVLVGGGWSLNIWESKWLPQLGSFKVLAPVKRKARLLRVADLIDKSNKLWYHSMIESLFLPIDVETILIKSAYKFILGWKGQASPGLSLRLWHGIWKEIWSLCIPPRIKDFIWQACPDSLPSKRALANKIQKIDARCELCRSPFKSVTHALFNCPYAENIWASTLFTNLVQEGPFRSVIDAIDKVKNSRKTNFLETTSSPTSRLSSSWSPPPLSLIKINFDGGKLREWARVKQSVGFYGPEHEEALAYVMSLANKFDFYSFSLVRRSGNRMAHALSHPQPFSPTCRVWLGDSPDHLFDLALDDLASSLDD
ncbi:LOW QUALITY PROTEIN: hypothetical protein Cgig2_019776 [Carnegiea gigantea]|uniref:Reverse transcriptase zinc-binding domain-containing protein n=1 Tax=Carnegiea gigantea TaxID=171969 RepID=A0A9Q1QGT7_9CARY|nr:LOW QUALITY PROTEIN: hypothetical protein Cgig2_019776 [Carnegiea gigantea]